MKDINREIASLMGHIRDARRHASAYLAGDVAALDLMARSLHVIERDAHYLIKSIVDLRIRSAQKEQPENE